MTKLLDQIVISRNLSELYIIDHSTTTEDREKPEVHLEIFYIDGGIPLHMVKEMRMIGFLYGQHFPHIIKPGLKDEKDNFILWN